MPRSLLLTVAVVALLGCNNASHTDTSVKTGALSASPIYWVFAHPDDETLAAAGALQKRQIDGQRNVVVFLTDGPLTSVRSVLWPTLENDDRTRQQKCRQARILESTAALAVQGVESENIVRFGYAEGQFTVADVKTKLLKLAHDSANRLRFNGHSPCDTYGSNLGGHEDHRKIAKALYELYAQKAISDVGFYRIGHLDGAFKCGANNQGHRVHLSRRERSIKLAARSEYVYPVDFEHWSWRRGTRWNYEHTQAAVVAAVAANTGRYGIAGLSVPQMWKAVERQPECEDFPDEVTTCYKTLVKSHPND
jgi:LmbE family N-acetylglucosaminyl deacetylase